MKSAATTFLTNLMLHAGSSISKGYVLPVNKQGIHDQRYYDAVSTALGSFASFFASPTSAHAGMKAYR